TACWALTKSWLDVQVDVNVSISGKDSGSVEDALRCLVTENDGFGPTKFADGGILAAVIAAGVKGKVSLSLMESGNAHESHNELIELAACFKLRCETTSYSLSCYN
ncbi:hypothetical protein Tco_1380211, partial [Tanacetum coccineum]